MQQAIRSAGLTPALISQSGLMAASGGSMWLAHDNLQPCSRARQRCQPMGIINSIPGSLHINLAADFKIKGLRSVFRARVPLRRMRSARHSI